MHIYTFINIFIFINTYMNIFIQIKLQKEMRINRDRTRLNKKKEYNAAVYIQGAMLG
jgi:hypothetical protein